MSFDKKPDIFNISIPKFNDQNQPDVWPNVVQARMFAIELHNVKFKDLQPNEQAFFNHIKNNIQYYDIIFNEKADGTISADIGSFDRHLVRNKSYLWIPFFFFSLVSNFQHFTSSGQMSLSTMLLNGFVFLIFIFGLITPNYKTGFERKHFYKWYPLLVALAALVSIFAAL